MGNTIRRDVRSGTTPVAQSATQTKAQTAANDGASHEVVAGDNLTKIAGQYQVALKDLIAANPQIENPDLIFPGQQIAIPARTDGMAAAKEKPASESAARDQYGRTSQLPRSAIEAEPRSNAPDPTRGPVRSMLGQLAANRRERGAAATDQPAAHPQASTAGQPLASTHTPTHGSTTASTHSSAQPIASSHSSAQPTASGGRPLASTGHGGSGAHDVTGGSTEHGATESAGHGGGHGGAHSASNLDPNAGAMNVLARDLNGSEVGTYVLDHQRGNESHIGFERGGGPTGTYRNSADHGTGSTLRSGSTRTTAGGDEIGRSESRSETRRNGSGVSLRDDTRVDAQGRRITTSRSSETDVDDGVARSVERRSATATNRNGNRVTSESETERHRAENGEESSRTTRLNQRGSGPVTAETSTDHRAGRSRAGEAVHRAGEWAERNVEANAVLYSKEVATGWQGAVTHDRRMTKDETGAGYEAHALAAQGKAGVAASVNLKEGKLQAGGLIEGQADLVGVSGRAQVGSVGSKAGALYAQGEAHVGARAGIGGGVEIDPRHGTAKVAVGAEAFAGAEVRGSAGYQNKYFGASVEARGLAGIGGVARAEVGMDHGTFKVKADLGACVGLGGRVRVDVQVNVAAIYQDGKAAVKEAAGYVKDKAGQVGSAMASGWNRVKSWF